jgi:hypothetical protein
MAKLKRDGTIDFETERKVREEIPEPPDPSTVTVHLIAKDLVVGSPEIGTPALGQAHTLKANDLTTESPRGLREWIPAGMEGPPLTSRKRKAADKRDEILRWVGWCFPNGWKDKPTSVVRKTINEAATKDARRTNLKAPRVNFPNTSVNAALGREKPRRKK